MSSVSMETTARDESARLYYLDWLRVLAILGVFIFHVLCVFNGIDFHIKNAEQSDAITIVNGFFFPWGMPLFFMIAGASSWFAQQRRTADQYARERLSRLLIPFVVGSILLSPIQRYFEWRHKVQTGIVQGSFARFLKALAWGPSPRLFGVLGYHLWFVGFLFCFSLLTLPLFRWLMGKSGQCIVSRIARLGEHRGGILLFILPLAVIRLSLHPFFPHERNWADFFFLLCYFILGHLFLADRRLTLAIRRDWAIMLGLGIASFVALVAVTFWSGEIATEAPPRTLADFVWWGLVTVCSWCWTTFMLSVGMRFLNFSNSWLQYAQQAILPFYMVHQPAIIVVAYFVVQWNATILTKVLVVALGSFAISIGLYQLIIRRVGLLQKMFGMKLGRLETRVGWKRM